MAGEKNETDEIGFRKVIEELARRRGEILKVFSDFVCMAACALASQTREEEYLEVAKSYDREELAQFGKALGLLVEDMEAEPFEDLLGRCYSEIASGFSRDLRGEFYTPKPVSDLMARVTVDVNTVVAAKRPVSVNEPASGSGGMILSLAECFAKAQAVDLLRVTCQDISKLACDMAYINLTLWGVPARVIWGDTLRGTVQKTWQNIHWYRVGENYRERVARFMSVLEAQPAPEASPDVSAAQLEPPPQAATAPAANASIRRDSGGQQEWVFG